MWAFYVRAVIRSDRKAAGMVSKAIRDVIKVHLISGFVAGLLKWGNGAARRIFSCVSAGPVMDVSWG